MTNLTNAVLGALVLNPSLIESTDLTSGDFPAGQHRRAFEAIAGAWEEGRPSEIDIVLLAEKLGGDGAASFISSLVDGNLKLAPEAFRARVAELRRRAISARIRRTLHEQDTMPELDLAEVRPLLRQLEELEAGPGPTAEMASPLITFPELRMMDIRVEWDIEALLPKNAVTFFYGKTSVGKTWVGLAMAETISTGLPLFGKSTIQRPVVYVDAENSFANIKERADILDMRSLNARVWHSSRDPSPPKLDGPDWERYDRILPPDCVTFFDTRRALTDGKENDDDVAALVMNRCKVLRDRNRTITILSHPTKANDRDLRGSGVWADLADHTLQFYKVKERGSTEEDSGEILPGSLLCLATGKKTRFAQISPIYLTLTDRGIELSEDPDEDDFRLIADYLDEYPDSNQGQIVKRVQEAKGKNDKGRFRIGRNAVLRLIALGEINKRWVATGKGVDGKRYRLMKEK